MKKLFTLVLLGSVLGIKAKAQTLLTEDFDFTAADINGQNGWTSHSGTADPVATTAGLTYAGYTGSGIGNAANVIGASYDYNKGLIDSISTNGSVIYTSLLLNFTQASTTATTGGYFFHLGNRASATNYTAFCARLWAKTDASGNLNIGMTNSSTASYLPTNFSLNTTYLVIIKYTINTAGNDQALMWIRSAGVPASEVLAGTPDVSVTGEGGQDIIDAIAIRQASNIPDYMIDGIRVGKSWSESVLPVTLKSISASLINNQPQVNWETSNETNFDYFGVEKSLDAKNFAEIAKVASNKASNGSAYQYADISKTLSTQFYRLKMVDNDGTFKYSSVVAVNGKASISLALYPNPVTNTIILSHPKAIAGAAVKVTSIDGKTLSTQNVQTGATQTSIDATRLVKGSYVVSFVNDGVASTTQLVKQ
jgi:Secretion system C-terminal sorting domain